MNYSDYLLYRDLGAIHEAAHALLGWVLGGEISGCYIQPRTGRGLTTVRGLGDDEAAVFFAAGSMGEFLYEQDIRRSRPEKIKFTSPYREAVAGDFSRFKQLKTAISWYQASDQALAELRAKKTQFLMIAEFLARHERLTAADIAQMQPFIEYWDFCRARASRIDLRSAKDRRPHLRLPDLDPVTLYPVGVKVFYP